MYLRCYSKANVHIARFEPEPEDDEDSSEEEEDADKQDWSEWTTILPDISTVMIIKCFVIKSA